jgi:hypothetical protein
MQTIREHLIGRHFNPDEHRCYISEEERTVTFPLWNLSGVFVGYQQYRPDKDKNRDNDPRQSRYFCYLSDERSVEDGESKAGRKRIGFWGVHTLRRPGPVIMCEGVFDAVRAYNIGLPCLAVLTSNNPSISSFLSILGRDVIAICDGDDAGRLLAKYGSCATFLPQGMDLGSLSSSEAREVIESSIRKLYGG